jgi:DNA-binding IclR family transcriptional regulator
LGFVEKAPASHLYRLSAGAFRLVHHIAERFGPNLKIANLLPQIAMETNASVYIHTLWGREVVLISAIGEFGPSTSLGTVTPVYVSAAGKMLVSQLPEESWPEFAPDSDAVKWTEFTVIDREHFFKELHQARASGVALAERTASREVCAIAAPIPELYEGRQFSVALVYPYREWNLKNLTDVKDTILSAAKRLAKALG